MRDINNNSCCCCCYCSRDCHLSQKREEIVFAITTSSKTLHLLRVLSRGRFFWQFSFLLTFWHTFITLKLSVLIIGEIKQLYTGIFSLCTRGFSKSIHVELEIHQLICFLFIVSTWKATTTIDWQKKQLLLSFIIIIIVCDEFCYNISTFYLFMKNSNCLRFFGSLKMEMKFNWR